MATALIGIGLGLAGCGSPTSQHATTPSIGSASSTATARPPDPPAVGDLGIGTHVCGSSPLEALPGSTDRLRSATGFETIYLDASLVSTPDVATLSSWLANGISPVIDLTFKNGPFTMSQIAADGPAVQTYLSRFVTGLQSLAERSNALDNGTSVYFSFEHESVVKINQGKFVYSGYEGRQPTISEAARAWNMFQGLVAHTVPGVVRLYWYGGSAPGENRYAKLLRPALIEMATFDPYHWSYDPSDATAADLWGPRIDHLLSRPWMQTAGGGRKPWGLTEWGTDRGFGDSNNARFVADTLSYLSSRGARFAIYFDCSDGPSDFIFTDGTQPLTLETYSSAVR